MPINQLTDEERAQLAKELGYIKIGKELPDGVTLGDITKTMPPEVGEAGCVDGSILRDPLDSASARSFAQVFNVPVTVISV